VVKAQTFYVSALTDNYNVAGGSAVYMVTITPSGVESKRVIGCENGQFFSIAMNKDKFFWLNLNGIFSADIKGDTFENCAGLAPPMSSSSALTLGTNGKLYYSSNYLFTTDIKTGKSDVIGPLNYMASGDMCFYNGELYMASFQGIAKINVSNPSQSTLEIPLSNMSIFGIVSVATGIRKNTVYGLRILSTSHTEILEFDMEEKRIVKTVGVLPYYVLDAASPVEDGSIIGIDVDKVEINQDCNTGTTGVVDIVPKPHLEDFTYTLNGITNTTGKFTGLAKGTYTFTIVSASDSYTGTVEVPAFDLIKPVYNWKIKNQKCETPGEITFTTADINTSYQIRYNNSVYPLNHTFSGLSANNTSHFEILNKYGCKVDEQDIRVGKDICEIAFDRIQIEQQCDVFHKGILTVLTKPHTAVYQYSLSNGEKNSTGIFKNLPGGNYILKIESDETFFETSATVPDFKLLQPLFSSTKVNPACATKGTIQFATGNPSLFKLKYQENLYPLDYVFNNLNVGTHHFVVLTASGCLVDEYDVKLIYEPCPIVITEIQQSAECNVLGKGMVQVIAPAIPETYTFTLNGISNNNGLFTMLEPGNYELEVRASGGAAPEYRNIVVPDYYTLRKPISLVERKNPVCDLTGQIAFRIGTNTSNYNIRFKSVIYPASHIFDGLYGGNYSFTILDLEGCILDVINTSLETEACNDVSFPNAFSPNADNVNDTFKAKDGSRASNFLMQIFDRKGVLVFSSNQLYNSWDGTYRGSPVPVGTYIWMASFTTQKNEQIRKNGMVTLIR